MIIKTHLAESAEPLKEGSAIQAMCGAEVKHAVFSFCWDITVMGKDVYSSLRFGLCCRKCMVSRDAELRYLYGVREGQEVQNELCES